MSVFRSLLPLATAMVLGIVPAVAAQTQAEVNAALRQDGQIQASLMAAGIAAVIAESCPTIDAREMRARADALGLYNHARGMGYTRAQIRAFIDDRVEKDRMRDTLRDWFAARGLQENDPAEGFCALGLSEIASGTPSARYLRAR